MSKDSERISLITPSNIASGVKSLAAIKNITVNELVNSLLKRIVDKNAAAIAKFESARNSVNSDIKLD